MKTSEFTKEERLAIYKLSLSYIIYPDKNIPYTGTPFICNLIKNVIKYHFPEKREYKNSIDVNFPEFYKQKPKYDILHKNDTWFNEPKYLQDTESQINYRKKVLINAIKKLQK